MFSYTQWLNLCFAIYRFFTYSMFVFCPVCVDMEVGGDVVYLSDLCVGVCRKFVVMKVNRIIFKEVSRVPQGTIVPVTQQEAIHVVVFDHQVIHS